MAQPEEGSGAGGLAGTAAFPDPWAPVWEPAAAGSITDLIRQLQQPAGARCRLGAPPPQLWKGRG